MKRVMRLVGLVSLVCVLLVTPYLSYAQGGTTHTVQTGENLFRIALRYNMTVEYLAAANGITDPTRIYVGQVIVIPDGTTTTTTAATTTTTTTASPAVNPAPAASQIAAAPVYHTVQAGETLASIGRTYGLGWLEIATANGITDPNHIYSGQQLTIPGATAPGTAAVAPAVDTTTTVNTASTVSTAPTASAGERTHVVQGGEHLASIAAQYGLTWPTLSQANNIADPNQIYPGQTLIIPAADIAGASYSASTWTAPAAPSPTIATGKQIFVDLSDQMTYAYENGQLLRSTRVSTGVAGLPTVQGDYTVYLKYTSQTMSGPGYVLPGVPYVMYFYKDYSLHGTYWHNNFGTPMSHGCVNMPTPESEWFFNWAPIGTPVHVQW